MQGQRAELRGNRVVELVSQLAAAAGPAIAWVGIGQPFDVVKTRLQTSSSSKYRVRSEGVLALWKGSLPAFLISVPYSTVLFASYDLLRPTIPGTHIDAPLALKIFAAGSGSGVFLTLFHAPLEMWKVRLQTAYSPAATAAHGAIAGGGAEVRTVMSQMMQATACHGLQSLFRGSSMLLLRNIPGNGIFFSAFEGFGALFERHQSWGLDPFAARLCVGGLTGATYQFSLYPCDVIKARLMTATHETEGRRVGAGQSGQSMAHGRSHSVNANAASTPPPTSIRGACAAVIREHGILGLYRGLGVTLLKAVPVNAAGMTLLSTLRDKLGVSSS